MIQYNFDRQTINISYLSKENIKDIDEQINKKEERYGKMPINLFEKNKLNSGTYTEIIDGIIYYNPFVSVWDYIKKYDDVLFVKLNLNNITDKKTAFLYADEIIKYIKSRILNIEIERL